MILAGTSPPVHLTYCTNIHPGESWAEVRENLRTHVVAVKHRVSPQASFGVGLRLSARAAQELSHPDTLADAEDLLASNGLYVFTINGFPYGSFHGTSVKERVYRPDWLEEDRLTYTDLLASLLARLMKNAPASWEGSISTVPGCFRERGQLQDVGSEIAERLIRHSVTVWNLREATGRTIGLALEPEPHCLLETVAETVDFFEREIFSAKGRQIFSRLTGVPPSHSEEVLRRHLGVCLDACHAAVEFEDPKTAVQSFRAAGVRVLKVQISAGLRVPRHDSETMRELARFAEGVYLHQVVIRRKGELVRVLDLPQALAATQSPDPLEEWRIHFHVPLFRTELGPFQNTQPFLHALLALQVQDPVSHHLEVETYTWDVLPEEYRREPVVEAIARELFWVTSTLAQGPS